MPSLSVDLSAVIDLINQCHPCHYLRGRGHLPFPTMDLAYRHQHFRRHRGQEHLSYHVIDLAHTTIVTSHLQTTSSHQPAPIWSDSTFTRSTLLTSTSVMASSSLALSSIGCGKRRHVYPLTMPSPHPCTSSSLTSMDPASGAKSSLNRARFVSTA